MKKYASTLITLGVIGLFAWYGFTHDEIFRDLAHVAVWASVLIIIGKLVNVWTTGLFTKWTVEAFTDTLSQRESFVVAVLTAIGNFFGPLFGGVGIRAIYLKKYHRLPYSKFTSTLIGYYQMMFQLNSLMAIVALLVLPHGSQTGYVMAVFGIWFIVLLGLALIKLPAKRRLAWLSRSRLGALIIKILYDIEDGWRLLISKRKLLFQMFVLAAANLLALYAVNYIEFLAFGIHVSAAAMALYTAIVQASMLLSITPGAVGLREAMLIIVAGTLGITNQQIIQVAILDRGIYFLLLGALFLAIRHSKLRQSIAAAK